ncbi:T9SS type A sorting domain-containing protein [Winogradskyella vidalii]|uniref:T9SS type A sorting domain-containing protein n=1 Tax=Winogradskyella vidalii TaxID=2615024 RepID=UPI0015CB305B|nr:T9SS type A sorting domain-containing protein [Winogradskyella vidalii]
MKKQYLIALFCLPFLLTGQTTFTSNITPDLSAYGETTNHPGEGEYQTFLSPDNILDKPIIVVDGLDIGDVRNIDGIYSLLDFASASGSENLADQLRDEGFDIVILNFPTYTRTTDNVTIDGGSDFIERNAMILVELLDIINAEKATNSPDQNVIIGPSMGGLIARYALNYMEANSLEADTRLYISFDAPHHGANIPIGLQHQLNYLAYNDLYPLEALQPLITNFLNSTASRQLLIDHFEAHLESGSLVDFDDTQTQPESHPFRQQFESNINGLIAGGFPQNTRNVAIINGSGIGSPYFAIGDSGPTVTNGFSMLSTTLPVTVPSPFGDISIDVEIDVNMTPEAGTPQQVSRFYAPIPIVPDIEAIANSGTTNFDGVDAAPGGLFEVSALVGDASGEEDLTTDFFTALQIDKFSFIPSVSALALDITEDATDNEINWHHSINLPDDSTPFVNIFMPDDNQPHLQLTQANVAFALNEILNPPLHISNPELLTFQLEKNPVKNELILNSNRNTKANISITDVSGKTVLKQQTDLSSRQIIPINLISGFYILNISAENNTSFTTKFIVNK